MQRIIFYGTGGEKLELHYDQPGARARCIRRSRAYANNLERRYRETQSDASKKEIEESMSALPLPGMPVDGLRPEALAVTVGEMPSTIATRLPVDEALAFLDELALTGTQADDRRRRS